MKKLNKVAMLFATAALATAAGAQTVDNWRNGTSELVWKNGNSELCWRDANWTPATAFKDCDGALKPAWRALIERFPDRFLFAMDITEANRKKREESYQLGGVIGCKFICKEKIGRGRHIAQQLDALPRRVAQHAIKATRRKNLRKRQRPVQHLGLLASCMGGSNGCRYDHFTMSGGKIDAAMKCTGNGATRTMTMQGNYSPDHYHMAIASTGSGAGPAGGMSMKMEMDAKRTGACTGKEDG